jgi:hypothetical protein
VARLKRHFGNKISSDEGLEIGLGRKWSKVHLSKFWFPYYPIFLIMVPSTEMPVIRRG